VILAVKDAPIGSMVLERRYVRRTRLLWLSVRKPIFDPPTKVSFVCVSLSPASVVSAAFAFRPMLDTDFALYDLIVAPVVAAAFDFHYRPMLECLLSANFI
jgi:hypothetical protein